jgi:hypothetical protein
MITIIHGGQTGVDRGAHEAAVDNDWPIAGYMPSDGRDELGLIPRDVRQHLRPHDKRGYPARTEANVRSSSALLVVVPDADAPRITPGTAKTIDLARSRRMQRMIADPRTDAELIAHWIWSDLLMTQVAPQLTLDNRAPETVPTRLLVAGPRESKWHGARIETAALLRRVASSLMKYAPRKEVL